MRMKLLILLSVISILLTGGDCLKGIGKANSTTVITIEAKEIDKYTDNGILEIIDTKK